METATLIISIASFILTLFALGLGISALVLVVGLKNSTHQVQYVPADEVIGNTKKKREDSPEDLYEHLL